MVENLSESKCSQVLAIYACYSTWLKTENCRSAQSPEGSILKTVIMNNEFQLRVKGVDLHMNEPSYMNRGLTLYHTIPTFDDPK